MQLAHFIVAKPDIEQLRRQYPEISDLLTGTFAEMPVLYGRESGTVVMWELIQGKKYNPSYGRIPPGHFDFSVKRTENITILDGTLALRVEKETQILKKQDIISVPPKTPFILSATAPVFILCEYKSQI